MVAGDCDGRIASGAACLRMNMYNEEQYRQLATKARAKALRVLERYRRRKLLSDAQRFEELAELLRKRAQPFKQLADSLK